LSTGTIIRGIGGFYYVKANGKVYECKARGVFRKNEVTPLPGDRVVISVIDESKLTASIDEILARSSQLIRPAVANVDQLVAVIAAKSPSPDFMLLDKLLVTAEAKGIVPVICINKIDLDAENNYVRIIEAYEKTGYKIIALSSKLNIGIDNLREVLCGHLTTFAGQSGVGKSTILNNIMKYSVMQTGEISEKIERGRHTTRHAELVELDSGGYIVDTPGFSSFELADIKYNELPYLYPEFAEHMDKCKFTGCSHISEPGCGVKDAVERGLVSRERYGRYVRLYNELKSIDPYKDKGKKQKKEAKEAK
jgi:ribosome biogenesis GTPase